MEKENVLDLNDFALKKFTLKLGKGTFVLRKPSVEQFVQILRMTQNIGEDRLSDNKTMIKILDMLLQNRGLFGWNAYYFRSLLRTLDEASILTVWNKCFLELGVIVSEPAIVAGNEA